MAKRGRPKKTDGMTQAERAQFKAENKKPPTAAEELNIYASGNGALHFVWQEKEYTSGHRIATGRRVTMDDARNFNYAAERHNHLLAKGWKLWNDHGTPVLVADIERTGPNTLRINDQEYTYSIKEDDLFYIRDKEIRNVSLNMETMHAGHTFNVRHLSTLSSAAYFLNHEEQMKANPPEPLTYQLA